MASGHPGTAGEELLFSPFHEILVQGQPGLRFPKEQLQEGPSAQDAPRDDPMQTLIFSLSETPGSKPHFSGQVSSN